MLFPVEQAFVGRDEKRAPLKTPAWEAIIDYKNFVTLIKHKKRIILFAVPGAVCLVFN